MDDGYGKSKFVLEFKKQIEKARERNCEYLAFITPDSVTYAHKKDCKFCKDRSK